LAPVNYAAGANPTSVIIGDFNGDGKLDLAVADLGGNNGNLLLGNEDGTFEGRLGLWGSRFEAISAFTLVTARWLAHHPKDGLVDRLSGFSCYPSYRALTFALVRLSSLNTPAFLGHTNMPVYPGALRIAKNYRPNLFAPWFARKRLMIKKFGR
jgi:hypothetical protein